MIGAALAEHGLDLSDLSEDNKNVFLRVALSAGNYEGYWMLLDSGFVSTERVIQAMEYILQQPVLILLGTLERHPQLIDSASTELREHWISATLVRGHPEVLEYFLKGLTDAEKKVLRDQQIALLFNENLDGQAGRMMAKILSNAGYDFAQAICNYFKDKELPRMDHFTDWGKETYSAVMGECL
ncbi:MAG: hypothetical protein AAF578_10255 [Pseudomonadota bacterium]